MRCAKRWGRVSRLGLLAAAGGTFLGAQFGAGIPSSASTAAESASLPNPVMLTAVGCHAPATCLAVGPNTLKVLSTYSVIVAADNGRKWVLRGQLPQMYVTPGDVSCGGARSCLVAGNTVGSSGPELFWTTDDAASWQRVEPPVGVRAIDFVSCPGVDVCAIEGHSGSGRATVDSVAITFDGGATWVTRRLPTRTEGILTCPAVWACYLAGEHDSASDSNGIESRAVFLGYRVGASGWRIQRHVSLSVLGDFNAFACSSTAHCVGMGVVYKAESRTSYVSLGVSLTTDDAGATWQRGNEAAGLADAYMSMACPAPDICVAGGPGSSSVPLRLVYRSTDGHDWVAPTISISAPRVSVMDASCAGVDLCVMVGGVTSTLAGQDEASILASYDRGLDWHAVAIDR